MSKTEKLLLRVLRGTSDADIGFDELCSLLTHMGFELRVRGSHHIFSKLEVAELINLQRDGGGNAKPYQVKQVRNVIVKYKLEV